MLNPIQINATTLPDAWFQTLYACVDIGRRFKIDRGSYAGQDRLEFDYITVAIQNPGADPLLPKVPDHMNIPNPVDDDYLHDYLPYLMTAEVKEGESYTYGQRLNASSITQAWPFMYQDNENKNILIQDEGAWENGVFKEFISYLLNQIDLMIWTYKNKGHRNNQMVLQIAQPSDMLLQDPPCLRHIDTRIQDDTLHFFPYFRSWDLYGGFPANLAAIELLKQYCADEIGVKNGMIIASSKGLHLYSYVIEIAEMIRGKSSGEFREETLNVLQNTSS
jgi:thymidylate synthase